MQSDAQPSILKPSVNYFFPKPDADLADLMVSPVCVGYFECDTSYTVQRNTYSSYLLLVMLSGALSYQTRRERGVARPGQVLLLDCNAPHSYAAQSRCSFTFLHFGGGSSTAICERIHSTHGRLVHVQGVNALSETLGELMNIARNDHVQDSIQTSALVYSLLLQLLHADRALGGATSGNALVDQAIAYIREHISEKLSVEDIAAHSGYSPSYFSHIFAQETGLSPYRFVLRTRLDSACHLLQTTKLSIQDIAFQTGFNSAANFCYTFRKEKGVSPQEYRKDAW